MSNDELSQLHQSVSRMTATVSEAKRMGLPDRYSDTAQFLDDAIRVSQYAKQQLTADQPTRAELLAEIDRLTRQVATEYVRGREHEQAARVEQSPTWDKDVVPLRQEIARLQSLLTDYGHDPRDFGPDGEPLPVTEAWILAVGGYWRDGHLTLPGLGQFGRWNGVTLELEFYGLSTRSQVRRVIHALGGKLGDET